MMREGTIVDATLIAAPPSTKNRMASATRKCINGRKAMAGTLA